MKGYLLDLIEEGVFLAFAVDGVPDTVFALDRQLSMHMYSRAFLRMYLCKPPTTERLTAS